MRDREDIFESVVRHLLERFGEPIGDTTTTVGVADERSGHARRNRRKETNPFGSDLVDESVCQNCGSMHTTLEGGTCDECGEQMKPGLEEEDLDEVAPEGWEGTVKAMKKHSDIKNPWALAWSMKNKGYKSHKKKK